MVNQRLENTEVPLKVAILVVIINLSIRVWRVLTETVSVIVNEHKLQKPHQCWAGHVKRKEDYSLEKTHLFEELGFDLRCRAKLNEKIQCRKIGRPLSLLPGQHP